MHISKINNFNIFTSRNKSTFRDEELFDNEKDFIKSGYSTYDGYDIDAADLLEEAIDYYYPNIDNNRIPEKQRVVTAMRAYAFDSFPASAMKTNQEIRELSMLKGDNGDRFSGNLYNHLVGKLGSFSLEQISNVASASKLTKANSREYVDFNLLEAGFTFLKKYPKASPEQIFDLMNSVVALDNDGNEIISLNALDYALDSKGDIKTCIKSIESGMNCDDDGVYINFDQCKAYESTYSKK